LDTGTSRQATPADVEPGERGMPPYLAVDGIKATAARVTKLGGQAGESMPVPGMGCSRPEPTRRGTSSGCGRPTHRPQLLAQ